MPLSPDCLVADNAGPFEPTTDGVDVGPGDTVSITLATPFGVGNWFLKVYGTDELTTAPTLTNVDPVTGKVTSTTSTVTFVYPGAPLGRAIILQSTVTQGASSAQTTFEVYSLTAAGHRVGAVGETREGDTNYGWAATVNPIIRAAGTSPGTITVAELPIVAGVFSTGFSTPTRAGSRRVPLVQYPPTVGSLTRFIAFYASLEATGGTCNVQLYDVDNAWVITGTSLSVSTPINTEIGNTGLPVGSSPGDLVDGDTVEVDISLTGGGPSDRAIVTNARLVVYYA
jgi:hypothetical protein